MLAVAAQIQASGQVFDSEHARFIYTMRVLQVRPWGAAAAAAAVGTQRLAPAGPPSPAPLLQVARRRAAARSLPSQFGSKILYLFFFQICIISCATILITSS